MFGISNTKVVIRIISLVDTVGRSGSANSKNISRTLSSLGFPDFLNFCTMVGHLCVINPLHLCNVKGEMSDLCCCVPSLVVIYIERDRERC